jgi:hypothetical protein
MKRAIILCVLSTTAFADSYAPKVPDFKNSREMADYYNERIEQRQRENLEQLHFEQEREQQKRIENELRELNDQRDSR